MRLVAGGQALAVAGAIAGQNLLEFLPIDRPVLPCAIHLVQCRVGEGEAEMGGLRHQRVEEFLAQRVVAEPLDLPSRGLVAIGAVAVGWAEHHEARPVPAVERVLRHRLLRVRAVGESHHDLVALALVKALFLAHTDHRAGIGAVGATAERDLVHDRGTVDQPADRAHVRPAERRIVEDRAVFRPAGQQRIEHFFARRPERLRGGIQIQSVPGFVLHLGQQCRLAAQGRCAGDPVALGQHADDFGMGVLGDLPG